MHIIRKDDLVDDSPAAEVRSQPRTFPRCIHADDLQAPLVKRDPIGTFSDKPGPSLQSKKRRLTIAEATSVSNSASSSKHCPLSLQIGASASVDIQLKRSDAISVAQLVSRGETTDAIRACLEEAWAPSTVARYNQSSSSCVTAAERAVGETLLPCRSDVHFMFLFASLDKCAWGKIITLKAAVRAWHLDRDLFSVLDACWTDRAKLFWTGLKKRADHSRRSIKRPISLPEFLTLQHSRLAAGSSAGLRDAALAGVAFLALGEFRKS